MQEDKKIELGPFGRGERVNIVVLPEAVDIPVTKGDVAKKFAEERGIPLVDMPISNTLRDHALALGLPAYTAQDGVLRHFPGEDSPIYDEADPVSAFMSVVLAKGILTVDQFDKIEALMKAERKEEPAPKREPLAFQYFQIRPCLETVGEDRIDSYLDEDTCEGAHDALLKQDKVTRKFYTLYGIDQDGLAMAIGDFTFKADAFEAMNAILSPMAKARDNLIDEMNKSHKAATHKDAIGILERAISSAADLLDDVINQSSNGERL